MENEAAEILLGNSKKQSLPKEEVTLIKERLQYFINQLKTNKICMNTRLRIIHAIKTQNFTILETELVEGDKILKNDVFFNDNKVEFIVKHIGIMESNLENIYPLTVEFRSEIKLQKLGGTFFEKKSQKLI